jgi:hypothetical protein
MNSMRVDIRFQRFAGNASNRPRKIGPTRAFVEGIGGGDRTRTYDLRIMNCPPESETSDSTMDGQNWTGT